MMKKWLLAIALLGFVAPVSAQTPEKTISEVLDQLDRIEDQVDGLVDLHQPVPEPPPPPPPEPIPEPIPEPTPEGVPPAIAAMALGSWLEYGAPWDEVAPKAFSCGLGAIGTQFRMILDAWNGWAPDGLRYRYVAASGGHADGCNNGIYRYNILTAEAELVLAHVEPNAGLETKQPFVADENGVQIVPRSSHTAYGQYIEGDLLYLVTGSVWDNGNPDGQVWRYHLTEKRWQRLPDRRDDFGRLIGTLQPLMLDTPDGTLLMGNWQLCDADLLAGTYDCQTDIWFRINSGIAWDHALGGFWHVESTAGVVQFFRKVDGTWERDEALSGVISDEVAPNIGSNPGICVVPDGGILVWSKSSELYLWDGADWSVISAPGGPPAARRAVVNKWSWDDEAQVCIGGGTTSEGLWIYKPDLENWPPAPTEFTVGDLVHDGPATPEQISLYLSVTGNSLTAATATVRYKQTGTETWMIGHPLFRIRPGSSVLPSTGSVPHAFAWPIIDLDPGTAYDVEVIVTSESTSVVKTASFTTRALPAPSGAFNKTIFAGASSSDIRGILNDLEPGDVLELQNGTYNVEGLQLTRGGTSDNPIYIRGESRDGVVLSDPTGTIIQIIDVSHVILERMTLQGSAVNGDGSKGISFWNGAPSQTRVTIRNVTVSGVDQGIIASGEIAEFLAYDNILVGNNAWILDQINTSATWNDDGIRIPGFGNAAFNNTLTGFGDSLSYTFQSVTESVGVHFYRNDVRNSGDDFAEVDAAHRNLTLYDNRSTNSMTFLSLDPLYGGPLVVARNIAINVGRHPFKWNDQNSGQFVYNNTIVRTVGRSSVSGIGTAAGWYQPNNGSQNNYGYQNNILVYRGPGIYMLLLESSGHDILDFTHNSWYPDLLYRWPDGRFDDLAQALDGLPPTTSVFSGITRRHEMDNITVFNPWTVEVILGVDYRSEVTASYTPGLAPGTAPKNSGVVIPNITDGFDGDAPDRGAVIAGRLAPLYGDRR